MAGVNNNENNSTISSHGKSFIQVPNSFQDQNESTNGSPFSVPNMEQWITKWMTADNIEKFQESCPVKVVTHGIIGKKIYN